MKSNKPLRARTQLKAKAQLKPNPKPKKQVQPTISKLKKQADKLFSEYIRLRDKNICITCNKVSDKMQAGHFMSRKYNSTRFNEQNTNAQCFRCNVLFYGEQFKYSQQVDLKYGDGTAKKLQKLSEISHRFTIEELNQIIETSKEDILFLTNGFI